MTRVSTAGGRHGHRLVSEARAPSRKVAETSAARRRGTRSWRAPRATGSRGEVAHEGAAIEQQGEEPLEPGADAAATQSEEVERWLYFALVGAIIIIVGDGDLREAARKLAAPQQ